MNQNPEEMWVWGWISDQVCKGNLTPRQGADLLALRDYLRWKRLPWWKKALTVIRDMVLVW